MKLKLEKFGKTLISRELGSEAFKALQPTLRELSKDEELEVDFSGILTLSPSWADEFLSPLLNQLGNSLILLPTDNLSVHATIRVLQEANKQIFKVNSTKPSQQLWERCLSENRALEAYATLHVLCLLL